MSYIYIISRHRCYMLNGMGSPEVLFMVRRSQIPVVGWKHGRTKKSTTNIHETNTQICAKHDGANLPTMILHTHNIYIYIYYIYIHFI